MTLLNAVDYMLFGNVTKKFDNVITAYKASPNDETTAAEKSHDASITTVASDVEWNDVDASVISLRHLREDDLTDCVEEDSRGAVSSKASSKAPSTRTEKPKQGGMKKRWTPKSIAFIPIPKKKPKHAGITLKPYRVLLPSVEEATGDHEKEESKISECNSEIDDLPVPKVGFFDNIGNVFDGQMLHLFCGNISQGVEDTITACDQSIRGYLTAMDETMANDASKTTGKKSTTTSHPHESSPSCFPKVNDGDSPGAVNEGGSPGPVNDGDGRSPANDGGIRDALDDLRNRGPVVDESTCGPVNDLDSCGPVNEGGRSGRVDDLVIRAPVNERGTPGPVYDLDSRGPGTERGSRGQVNDLDSHGPVEEGGNRGRVNDLLDSRGPVDEGGSRILVDSKPSNRSPLKTEKRTRKRGKKISETPKRNDIKENKSVSEVGSTIQKSYRVPLPSEDEREEKEMKRNRSSEKRPTRRPESTTRISNESPLEDHGILRRRRSRTATETVKAVGGSVCSEESFPARKGGRRSPYLITRERSRSRGSRGSNRSRCSNSSRRTSRSKNLVTKASLGVPLVVKVL